MQYETTGGDIIITIPNCDCGLTGGCEKCQPIIISKNPTIITFLSQPLPQVKMRVIDNELFQVIDDFPPDYRKENELRSKSLVSSRSK